MKILIVSRLFHNVVGGVERMAVELMNELVSRGHEIHLLSWDRTGAISFYTMDTRIHWHRLDLGDSDVKAGLFLRIRRQFAIRRIVNDSGAEVILAFQHGPFLTTSLARLGLRIPIIAAERNAPQRFDHLSSRKYRAAIFQSFRLADAVTVQMHEYRAHYPKYLQRKLVHIPNPVKRVAQFSEPGGIGKVPKNLLCVGRLSYQKNQSALLQAFASVTKDFSEWRLVIVGSGEDQDMLIRLATQLKIDARTDFIGSVTNVDSYYCSSHLFCLPSRWEGFPNALAESMSHGLPAIGYDGCAGVRELIVPGVTGQLAHGNGDPASLALALRELMSADAQRIKMGKASIAAVEKFTPSRVFDQWEELLIQVGSRG